MRFRYLLSIACCLMVAGSAFAQAQQPRSGLLNRRMQRPGRANAPVATPAPTPAPAAPLADGEVPAFNWDQAPVDIVLQAYGDAVDKTILKDPNVPNATITLKSRQGQKLTKEEYLEAIETVLEMNQIHLEPYGERFIRALPRKDVRKEGIPLILDAAKKLQDTGRVISMMIPFKNITTDEAQKVLEGLKSNSGVLLVFERTNSILVTDTEQNINRMLDIARLVDVATPVTENVFVRQIKNAAAEDIKTALEQIVQDSQKDQEKNGKVPSNAHQQQQQPRSIGGRVLGRNNNNNQPAAPVNNESLVMSVSDAARGMIRGKVLILSDERSNKLIIITSQANMDFFDKVIEALDIETTPDTVVKVYRLKYAEAEDVSDMINDLIGGSGSSKNSSKNSQNANSKKGSGSNMTSGRAQATQKKPANQRSGEAKAGELTKDNTTVLADKRINGLVVMTEKELVPTIEQIIESMDIKLSQVLIETCIIEVTLGDGLNTGVDWVRLGDKQATVEGTRTVKQMMTDEWGRQLYWKGSGDSRSSDETTVNSTDDDGNPLEAAWQYVEQDIMGDTRSGFWNGAGNAALTSMTGGGGGTGSEMLSAMLNVGTNVTSITPIGSGLNYFFKSDALNLGAVITAAKTDTRAKYIASPVVMTVDNKEATIEATESRKFYSGSTSTSSGSSLNPTVTYNYSDKDIGIKIKVTPKINPNGTVMLEVEEEYSQLGAGQDVLVSGEGGKPGHETIDTALARKMSADVLLENTQTVVLGGLTETYNSEAETGIPILKDIPWIGKWLFGSVSQTESRKELLVFMTPYVLNDAEAAQVEALRRKKALSDTRPWDDHGWSASTLADPVSKKEQMRRLKDEWKKQDEERKTRISIEKEKVERAKKLQELSKEERELWLKMHKDELEKEKQEELEKKMLDKDSQEELKKLAEKVRADKLAAAEKELKKAEKETLEQNERAKLDAEKKEKGEAPAKPKEEKLEEVKGENVEEIKVEPKKEGEETK